MHSYRYPGDDHRDLMAGVDELIRRGWADPQRLGVTGGSGGGLLTNWAVTQTTRFRAAVSQRDIADWSAWWYTADFTLFQRRRDAMMTEMHEELCRTKHPSELAVTCALSPGHTGDHEATVIDVDDGEISGLTWPD